MRTREKIELGLIATVSVVTWFFATRLPVKLPAGYLILAASVLLLGQGLLRDLYVKYVAKKDHPAADPSTGSGLAPSTGSGLAPSTGSGLAPSTGSGLAPSTGSGLAPSTGSGTAPKRIVCMCMESTVGVAGVIGGLAVLLCGIGRIIEVPTFFWPALVIGVGVVGFVIKDFVLDWKARSVRRVKDHQSIIPW